MTLLISRDTEEKEAILICNCGTREHQIHFLYDDEDNEMSICYFLEPGLFWERIVNCVKYLFGFRSRFGHFGSVSVNKEDVKKLTDFLGGL